MLHIIGLIFKIIGIIIGVILAIAVLLVCIVLFSPIQYEVKAEFPGDYKKIKAGAKVSWIFHLFSFQAMFQEQRFRWKARAAWIRLGEKKEKTKKTRKSEPTTQVVRKIETVQETKIKEEEMPKVKVAENEKRLEERDAIAQQIEESYQAKEQKSQGNKKKEKSKEQPKKKKRSLGQKVRNYFKKIKYTWNRICDKIKILIEKKEQAVQFVEDEDHKAAYQFVLKNLIWIKRFLGIRRIKGDLTYGFDDPYRTGQILAVSSILFAFIGEYINLTPDFENEILSGKLYIKGKIRLIYIVILAVRLLLNRSIRKTYKDIMDIKDHYDSM